jgi:hypothetical protein
VKAIVYEKYGSPDVLELRDIEVPRDKRVLRSRIPRTPDSLAVHAHRRPCTSALASVSMQDPDAPPRA